MRVCGALPKKYVGTVRGRGMKTTFTFASVLAVGLLAAGADASAITLLDQQPDQVTGLFADSTGATAPAQRVADDFTLSDTSTIESISFWGGYYPNELSTTDNFTIQIFSDDAANPGGLLMETTFSTLDRAMTGNVLFGVSEYEYDGMLTDSFVAMAGTTYWLSLTNDTGGVATGDSWFWESSSDGGNEARWSGDEGATWNLQPNGLSFVLNGTVPSPAALALLGVAGCFGRRRRN